MLEDDELAHHNSPAAPSTPSAGLVSAARLSSSRAQSSATWYLFFREEGRKGVSSEGRGGRGCEPNDARETQKMTRRDPRAQREIADGESGIEDMECSHSTFLTPKDSTRDVKTPGSDSIVHHSPDIVREEWIGWLYYLFARLALLLVGGHGTWPTGGGRTGGRRAAEQSAQARTAPDNGLGRESDDQL